MVVTDLEVLQRALEWADHGQGVTLATVVKTWGSAPRKAGAQMAIRNDGVFVGSVSGGCVEGSVIQEALDVSLSSSRLLTFGVSTEDAWAVGLSCGGEIAIWIESVNVDVIQSVVSKLELRQRVTLRLSMNQSHPMTVVENWQGTTNGKTLLQDDGAAMRVYNPARRLFVVGAVHIAQALIPMAKQVGYTMVVIDPRGLFLNPERWGNVPRVSDFPEEYLSSVNLGEQDAVVALSHNPTFDDEALYLALQANAFYVGALGSRRNHAKRCIRLQERGCTDTQIDRLCGPIGLNIGSQTPAEIAVSIVAEMIQHQYSM
jgi:xanthine dehydrogenase accessory factor